MKQFLAVYDPSGKLGLTDPSPGGGSVPLRFRGHVDAPWRARWEDALEDGAEWDEDGRLRKASSAAQALLLRIEDGTVDPIGMARAREVLAKALAPESETWPISGGVYFGPMTPTAWAICVAWAGRHMDRLPNESAPEAMARLLAEHAGCEVIRG